MLQNFYFNPLCLIQIFTCPFTFQNFQPKKKTEEADKKIESNMKCQSEIFKIKMAKMKIITNCKSQKYTLFSKRKLILCINFSLQKNTLHFYKGNVIQCPKSISLKAIFRNILLEK